MCILVLFRIFSLLQAHRLRPASAPDRTEKSLRPAERASAQRPSGHGPNLQSIRPIIVGRHNWLLYDTTDDADTSMMYIHFLKSLVQTV